MYRVLTVLAGIRQRRHLDCPPCAEHLGWKLLDSALIEAIVEKANVDPAVAKRYDEKIDPWLHRISRKALWHGAFESVATLSETDVFDAQTMAILTRRIIDEAAELGGCVIVAAAVSVCSPTVPTHSTSSSTLLTPSGSNCCASASAKSRT